MAVNTKINLNNNKVVQQNSDNLTLCGNNLIDNTTGKLSYSTHPNFTGNTQVVDKQYVDESVLTATGATVYNLNSPATTSVGGISAGYVLSGKTTNCLLKEMLTPYQTPTFSSFSNNVSTPVEVGCTISGSKSFSWAFTNGTNVQANTMCIRDVTASVNLSTNISTTSPQSASITTKTFTSCGDTQVWCGSAKNSCSIQFNSSNYTVTSYLPYFYGVSTGVPTPGSALISGGSKVIADSSGQINITYGVQTAKYLWFATPVASTTKQGWYEGATNKGNIGSISDLFNAPTTQSVNSPSGCWSGQTYKFYISNYSTSTSANAYCMTNSPQQ